MDEEKLRERLDAEEPSMESIRKFFADKLGFSDNSETQPKVIEDLTFDGLMKHWKEKGFKKIVTMVGAGISTSAGIPDFRSPGSGLYDNLQKYNLPHPTSIFEMEYFRNNPKPFFALARELYPGTFNPTPSHYFVRLLHEKGLLVRHYTQNIDTLERIAGIPAEKLVEAHGTFYTNHCLECREPYTMEWMKEQIFSKKLPTCTICDAVVKPDIVFFGENLPEKFYTLPSKDFKNCDLLIIMGTSLEVQPFASLVDNVGPNCVRLLINRDAVGTRGGSWFSYSPGLLYDRKDNSRDVAYIGDCDAGVYAVAEAMGWDDELKKLIETDHKRLDSLNSSGKKEEKLEGGSNKNEDGKEDNAASGSKVETKKQDIKFNKEEKPEDKIKDKDDSKTDSNSDDKIGGKAEVKGSK